jgi:hypothetical protein
MLQAVLVPVHILVGTTAVGCGIRAMRTRKGSRWHRRWGTGYLATVPVLCTTGTLLVLGHWPQDAHLLALAVLTAAPAGLGYTAARRRWAGWTGAHISGMGGAFIVMLSAFYVDNGPTLPGWGWVPTLAWWLAPSLVGLPVVARALRRHTGTPVPWGGRLRWPAAAPRLPPARPSARGSSHDRRQRLAVRSPDKEARRW